MIHKNEFLYLDLVFVFVLQSAGIRNLMGPLVLVFVFVFQLSLICFGYFTWDSESQFRFKFCSLNAPDKSL